MKNHFVPAFAIALLFSVGCRTQRLLYGNYQSFNRDDVVLNYSSFPKVSWSGKTPDEDYADAIAHNFVPIGESRFSHHRSIGSGHIANLARRQGASIACVYSAYGGHETVYESLAIPSSSTTHTSLSGYSSGYSSYSGWGSSSFTGSATSTTYGSRNTLIPIVRHWRNYRVILYAQLKEKQKMGLVVANLSEKRATEIGTRHGVVVQAVPKGSPCYDADILNDDIITHIDGYKIRDVDSFKEIREALPPHGEITMDIIRKNAEIKKRVHF